MKFKCSELTQIVDLNTDLSTMIKLTILSINSKYITFFSLRSLWIISKFMDVMVKNDSAQDKNINPFHLHLSVMDVFNLNKMCKLN